MGAMGFIHQHRQSPRMQQLEQAADLSGITVIRGVHQHRSGDATAGVRQGVQSSTQTRGGHGAWMATIGEKRHR